MRHLRFPYDAWAFGDEATAYADAYDWPESPDEVIHGLYLRIETT